MIRFYRLLACFVFCLAAFRPVDMTGQVPDSTDQKSNVSASGRVMLANAGFAPVPAFSFNSPLMMGFLSLKKKRFSFEPDLALGLNGKPWLVNNWFRLAFIDRKKLKATVGLNPSLYFGEVVMLSGESIIRAHRNLTFEFAGEQTLTSPWALRWTYLLVHAFDTGALSGQFFDVSNIITALRLPKILIAKVKPEVFYFNFDGNIDGFYGSGSVTADLQCIPLSVYFQGVQPFWAGFPGTHYKWNAGLVYGF
ncbi:hypothetical protein [Chryseolinea serpens]|nr:hypothetical protein [Chryseolinea serpens]